MTTRIRISGDFNVWTLNESIGLAQLAKSDNLRTHSVKSPLSGTMLLSAKGAASFTLLPPGGGTTSPAGWIPGDVAMMTPHLYLPSGSPQAARDDLYPLVGVDLSSLKAQITKAMANGSETTVHFGGAHDGPGVLLNGAELTFVVITEPITR